jgi:predicted TPR repeat methyltransferase
MNDALHDEYAADYDAQAGDYGWFPEIVLGLCFEFIQTGEFLLDLGIGTGLGSLPFARLGLQVTGLDESARMLKVCENKGFAQRLDHWDIYRTPWPYENEQFDHVICLGVLHFFSQPEPIFDEITRVLRADGLFAFTTNQPNSDDQQAQDQGDYHMRYVDGVEIYSHDQAFVQKLVECHNLQILKHIQVLLGFRQQYPEDLINVYVSRKRREEDNF